MKRETLTVHALGDPAFTGLAMAQLLKYATRRDASVLPTGACAKAITYHFRRLTRKQLMDFVEIAGSDSRKYERAFMAGIVRITGGDLPVSGWEPAELGDKAFIAMSVDEVESLEQYGVSIADMLDVGSVIYVRSFLLPKSAPVFPRPPMSLLAWDALDHQSVVQSPAESDPSSGEPSTPVG